jgi:hypothetical protein
MLGLSRSKLTNGGWISAVLLLVWRRNRVGKNGYIGIDVAHIEGVGIARHCCSKPRFVQSIAFLKQQKRSKWRLLSVTRGALSMHRSISEVMFSPAAAQLATDSSGP